MSRWNFLSYCLDESYLRCFYLCFLGLLFWWKLLIMSCFLTKKIFKEKVIDYILCQLYFFKSIFEQKVHLNELTSALHLNESCLCCLLCLFRCIKIFEWSLCVFFWAKYFNKKNKTVLIASISILLIDIVIIIFYYLYHYHFLLSLSWWLLLSSFLFLLHFLLQSLWK